MVYTSTHAQANSAQTNCALSSRDKGYQILMSTLLAFYRLAGEAALP